MDSINHSPLLSQVAPSTLSVGGSFFSSGITRTCLRDPAPTAPNSQYCPYHTKMMAWVNKWIKGLKPKPSKIKINQSWYA